jgi:HAE1 family hydrophobic/amphiphilic exporter-1
MNIAKFSVTRPVAVTMRIAALVLLGYVCLTKLPIDLLPKVDIPFVSVSVNWPNTSPEEMETQIARPLEQAVSTVAGMQTVSSSSSLGSANVRIQFNYGVDTNKAAIDVMQAVQRAQRGFPNDPNISTPTVFKFDPNQLPILVYGVSGSQDPVMMQDIMTNEIGPILESAGGVAQVNVSGGQQRAIIIDADPTKLQAYGLSLNNISTRLKQENISLPAGVATQSNTEYSIRGVGYFTDLDQIRALPVANVNGRLVPLSDLATVRDASQDVRSYIRMEGQTALNVSVTKQTDANTVDTANNVKAAIATIQKRYPFLKFNVAYDQSEFVVASVGDLQRTAMIGGILAILIITFFLRNLRSTFVVALSIPISIMSTFALIYFCGFTLNTISLSGLALATGLIVDDAIVVLENIYRHIERDGKRAAEAAVSGTQEIIGAVIASTFTVMVVFLPLLLIKGQTGQTFTQFSLVVVFSLSISLLDAMTVVPMLASRLVREDQVIEEAHPETRALHGHKAGPLTRLFDKFGTFFTNVDEAYRRGLEKSLKRRWLVIAAAVGSVAAAALIWPMVGREQLPPTDSGNLTVRVKLPVGTSIATTNGVMMQVEKILQADKDVETMIAGAGTGVGLRGGGGGGGGANSGSASIKLKDNRKSSTADVVKRLQAKLNSVPGVRPQVSSFDIVANILGGGTQGEEIDIYGADMPTLTKVANDVEDAVRDIPGLSNVDLTIADSTPEVQWKVDRDKAQTLNVSFQDVANTLAASTNGVLSTYYQQNGYQYPIYVQVPRNLRNSIDQLGNLAVIGTENRPRPVLLKQVATAVLGTGPNQIQRQNRQRYIGVTGQILDRPQSDVEADITKALDKMQFPQGYYWSWGLQQQQRSQEYSGLALSVFLAIALIYMLLASQFESFIYPLVVLTSVPLCTIGMVLGLFLTNRNFGLTAFIGLLMLIGIVVKNGILLVDYTTQLRARGMPRDEALLTAGPTRLRPILMTTLAAILGMLPLALGIGKGSEMYVPLATVVIGGLITSTMLTLFVVPTVYTYFDDLGRRFRKDPRDLDRATLVEPSVESAERKSLEPAK